MAIAILAGCASPSDEFPFRRDVDAPVRLDVRDGTGYPLVPFVARRGYGACALEWMRGDCLLIGLRGPVRLVSERDDFLNVLDNTVEFDRSGTQARFCHRGHTDFAGWSCSLGALPGDVSSDVQQDEKGRLIRQLHRSSVPSTPYDLCRYDDNASPPTSECNDGYESHVYTYDASGRPLTYARRRLPQPGETAETSRRLDETFEIRYSYVDDDHGNWIQCRMIYGGGSATQSFVGTPDVIQRRTIEYYKATAAS